MRGKCDGNRVIADTATGAGAERSARCFILSRFGGENSLTHIINPPINVLIDGKEHCRLLNGGSHSFVLESGAHTVELSTLMSKRRISIDLTEDHTLYAKWNLLTGRVTASF